MIRMLAEPSSQPGLADDEKDALFISLSLTLSRALYHRARFDQVIAAMNERRKQTTGLMSFDLFGEYTLFEAAAVLAGC